MDAKALPHVAGLMQLEAYQEMGPIWSFMSASACFRLSLMEKMWRAGEGLARHLEDTWEDTWWVKNKQKGYGINRNPLFLLEPKSGLEPPTC